MIPTPILFDRYRIGKEDPLPHNIPLEGAVAITRDTTHHGFVGKGIFTVQSVHNAFMRLFGKPKADTHLRHGVIVLGRDPNPEKPNNLLIAHSTLSGIKMSSWNYHTDSDMTQFMLWVPKSENLREALVQHANQTAYNRYKADDPDYTVQRADFSYPDIAKGIFYNHRSTPSRASMELTARATAQLLIGEQFLDEEQRPQSFFCTPYVITVLQGTLLLDKLRKREIKRLAKQEVQELQDQIFVALMTHAHRRHRADHALSKLSKEFWENPVIHLNGRYVLSCYAARALDKVSDVSRLQDNRESLRPRRHRKHHHHHRKTHVHSFPRY